MFRLSHELLAQLKSSKDIKSCREKENGEIELALFPYPRKQYDAVVVTNLQSCFRENHLKLPNCGCLMPVLVRTRKRAPIPDIEKWSRLSSGGVSFERPEDVPKTVGSAVFFICGRGQSAVDSREDCGYYLDLSFIYLNHKITGYPLHMIPQEQMEKYTGFEMGNLRDRTKADRAVRYKRIMQTKEKTKEQKARELTEALKEMGQDTRHASSTGNNMVQNLPHHQSSHRGYETSPVSAGDDAFFLCPNCESNQSIENIAEHMANCQPQEPRISGGSILRRRALIGASAAIPTGPPRYGRGSSVAGPGPTTMQIRGELSIGRTLSAAGPGPATMASRRRSSTAELPPAKRRRVQSGNPSTPTTLPIPPFDVIELSSDDEPTIQPPPQAVRFFAEHPDSPRAAPQVGRHTPPPPYSG